ncbi:MAG TPA: hypothetical protein PLF11_07430 [Bacillota bacterium]|nr:hypothetical protein [Bacillota bacterium]
MLQVDKIFLGHTAAKQRAYLRHALTRFREGGCERVVIPCCGQFSLAFVAVEAGYRPSQVCCSDISLFSGLIGHLCSGVPIEALGFTLAPEYQEGYDQRATEIDRAAYLFWLMKVAQLQESKNPVLRETRDYFTLHQGKVIERVRGHLEAILGKLSGIRYMTADVRDVLRDSRDPQEIVLVNPPVYEKGYEKQFDFHGSIVYSAGVEEFSWKKEYLKLFDANRENPAPMLWLRVHHAKEADPENIVFAQEFNFKKSEFWLINNPAYVEKFGLDRSIDARGMKRTKPLRAKVLPADYEICPDTQVSMKMVKRDVAMYYRDLFAHKMGQTAAEWDVVMLLDGMVFGVFGLHTRDLRILRSDIMYEVYGFNRPLAKYPNANRLLMLCITTKRFRDWAMRLIFPRNRLAVCNRFKTTCFSKYRTVKLNHGILNRISREKLENGNYKTVWETEWRDQSYAECVRQYLNEVKG